MVIARVTGNGLLDGGGGGGGLHKSITLSLWVKDKAKKQLL